MSTYNGDDKIRIIKKRNKNTQKYNSAIVYSEGAKKPCHGPKGGKCTSIYNIHKYTPSAHYHHHHQIFIVGCQTAIRQNKNV